MFLVIPEGFLSIEAQGTDDRQIVEGEEAGILTLRGVAVLMRRPGWNAEYVLLAPVEALPGDDGIARALGGLVAEASGMAMRLGALARPQHLHRGADGLHDRPSG